MRVSNGVTGSIHFAPFQKRRRFMITSAEKGFRIKKTAPNSTRGHLKKENNVLLKIFYSCFSMYIYFSVYKADFSLFSIPVRQSF